jgi:hypothetical protein
VENQGLGSSFYRAERGRGGGMVSGGEELGGQRP